MPRDRVAAQAAKARPTDLISATLILKDLPADWKSFRDAPDQASRTAWIQARRGSLAPTRQALLNWLAAQGAVDVNPFWITNQIQAFIPAAAMPAVLARPEVIDV